MTLSSEDAWQALAEIRDPEIKALSIVDLGIVRRVEVENGSLRITLTPTYSGCPALKVIEQEVASALQKRGFPRVLVETALSPAWSSDDISEAGRRKLEDAGIAPPLSAAAGGLPAAPEVRCPYCGSVRTTLRSPFGSTACKSLRYCNDCNEAFEHFKSV